MDLGVPSVGWVWIGWYFCFHVVSESHPSLQDTHLMARFQQLLSNVPRPRPCVVVVGLSELEALYILARPDTVCLFGMLLDVFKH